MMRIRLLFLLAALCLAATSGQAQLSSSPGFSAAANIPYSGNSSSAGITAFIPSSAECPTGAGSIIPAHNFIRCTITGNISVGLPSPFADGAFYRIQLIQDATGGRTASPLPASSFMAPPGLLNSNGSFAISTTPNSISELSFHTSTVASTNYMVHDAVTAGMTSYSATWTSIPWSTYVGGTTSAVTLNRSTGSIGAGNCVIIAAATDSAASIAISDGVHTYTTGPSISSAKIYYELNGAAGGSALTLTPSGGSIYTAFANEFAGCGSATDGSSTASVASATPSSGNFTTTANNDLIFGFAVDTTAYRSYDPAASPAFVGLTAANLGYTAGGAYTNTTGTYRYTSETESYVQPTAGSVAAAFVAGSAADTSLVIGIAFKHQ